MYDWWIICEKYLFIYIYFKPFFYIFNREKGYFKDNKNNKKINDKITAIVSIRLYFIYYLFICILFYIYVKFYLFSYYLLNLFIINIYKNVYLF